MIGSWRKKKAGRGGSKRRPAELVIPNHFKCPISLDLMKDPVTISTGITYDRESIEKWIEAGNLTCPATNQVVRSLDTIPNHIIRGMIQEWCVENRSHGVERIPTPRVPISSNEVIELLDKMLMARDPHDCKELVGKLIKSMKESDRNKKCVVSNGASRTLSLTFQNFVDSEGESVISLLEEVLSGLTLVSPLDLATVSSLNTARSLDRIVWFLNRGSLPGRRNAILILKEIISKASKEQVINSLVTIEGALEGLVKLVKNPICPSTTKASLVVIYQIITCTSTKTNPNQNTIVSKFVQMGLLSFILDTLVETDKSTSEKALGVLDGICRHKLGLEAAYDNRLTIPVVVKKILRVSDMATEFSVSILWKLIENGKIENGEVVVEALQVGAFQKLLLILQVGWNINERTKDKVTKLLKVLNLYRDRVECIDSIDFKDLKRPF